MGGVCREKGECHGGASDHGLKGSGFLEECVLMKDGMDV